MQTKVEVPSVTGEAIWSEYFKKAPHGMVLFRVVRKPGGGLDDSYRYDDVFELALISGEWRIYTAPWNLTICYPETDR